jgi:hypothetical protein
MANFSKEYNEKYFPEWCDGFSVMEIFNKLPDGYYMTKICEGFGFFAIQNNGGVCEVAFLTNKNEIGEVWVPFDEVDNQTYKQYR